ncbi:MAG: hypothetical protein RLZZ241_2343 [Bacteroidota bacterium]|jgi:ABC-type Fe3+/spermidine/putrescine transport system ATPase subunit
MLSISGLSFSYASESVLNLISFDLKPGEILAVMGESGCGKSTLLKLIYGELPFNQGTIHWKESAIKGPDYQLLPGAPYMKYLAQDFDLMPFLSVEENIHKFLSVREAETSKNRGEELMSAMELLPYRDKKVRDLSGGQQQRVALARVLAQRPELLLLDEPFSHIDYFRRTALRRNLFTMIKEYGITCICATHDAQDVLPYTQKVLVLRNQKIIDFRDTKEIYEKPKNPYVASLFGEVNLIPVNVLKPYGTSTAEVIVYADELQIAPKSGMKTEVKNSLYFGGYYRVSGVIEGETPVQFNSPDFIKPGKTVFLNIPLDIINKRLFGPNTPL